MGNCLYREFVNTIQAHSAKRDVALLSTVGVTVVAQIDLSSACCFGIFLENTCTYFATVSFRLCFMTHVTGGFICSKITCGKIVSRQFTTVIQI